MAVKNFKYEDKPMEIMSVLHECFKKDMFIKKESTS